MSNFDYLATIGEGIRLRAAGDRDEAMAVFTSLTLERPENLIAYLEGGQTQLASGNSSVALEWFKKAEVIAPDNFWPYFRQAEVLSSMMQYDKALEIVEAGLIKCKGRVSGLEYTNLIKKFLDVKALYLDKVVLGAPSFMAALSPLRRPIPGGLHVVVAKDAQDVIFASLEASYRAGLRYFALADNASSDNTRSEMKRFKAAHTDCIVFILDDPIVAHHQAAKLMALVRMASTVLKEVGIELDWIFPLDADELLYIAPGAGDLAGLMEAANASKKSIIVYYHYNAFSTEIYSSITTGADVEKLFPRFEPLPFIPVRKVAFRNSESAYVEEGNHFCSGLVTSHEDAVQGSEFGLFLRHYPIRSVNQLRSKIINGGRSISPLLNPDIGAHWRVDYDNYLRLGESYVLQRINSYNLLCGA